MDPPMLVNENSFPSTNGAPCNFSEIWQVPINGRLESSHFSGEAAVYANQDFSASDLLGNSARRRRDAVMEEEEADRAASTSNANPMNDNANKRLKTLGSGGKNQHTKEESEDGKGANQGSKLQPEPSKDYIHVRARRGQATDSHSLAERARREKISDRMNTLQDLVPGCNKVIGKAMVLDEIINYVQSLQQQVEFLSMKLEAVNSRMNVGLEGYPLKNFGQVRFDPSVADYSPQAPKNT